MKFSSSWEICWGHDSLPEETEIQEFATREWAHRWLLRFRRDQFRMTEFRRMLERANHSSLDRCDDDEVLRLLGSEIGSGRFRLVRWKPAPSRGGGGAKDESAASQPKQEAGAPPPPAPRRPAPEPVADEPTFPAEADPVAIAAAQQEAALLGVPFCEECAKKALANALL